MDIHAINELIKQQSPRRKPLIIEPVADSVVPRKPQILVQSDKEDARAREYEIALQWLIDGGLIHKVPDVKSPRIHLKSYEDDAAFKIFAVEFGLLGAMCGLYSRTIGDDNRIFTDFNGALPGQLLASRPKLDLRGTQKSAIFAVRESPLRRPSVIYL